MTSSDDDFMPGRGTPSSSETAGSDALPAVHDATTKHELSPSGLSTQLVPPASLVVVGGTQAGKVYGLARFECLIGRSADATIVIADRAVSTRHAIVRRCGQGRELVDLGSTNGTLLNGTRLRPNNVAELHPGDLIQIADVSLVYLAEGMSDVQDVTQALTAIAARPTTGNAGLSNIHLNPDEVLLQILKLSMPPEEPPKVPLDVQVERAVALIKKYSKFLPLVAAVAAAGALLGVGTVVLVPPLAEATFGMVLTPRASDNPIEERHQVESFEFFNMAEGNFTSSRLIESTLMKLGIQHPPDKTVESVAKRLELVSLSPNAALGRATPASYRGTFKDRSASDALRFLRAHVENYLESEINKTLAVIQKQVDFLESTTHEKETELRATEAKMKDFQSKYQESLPQFADGHVTSLETLRQQQADLQGRAQAAGATAAAARRELARMAPRDQIKMGRASPYQAALTQARVALADAQARGLADSHPEVVKIKSQIVQYEELSAKEMAKSPSQTELAANAEAGSLRRDLAARDAEEQGISAQLSQVSGQIARIEKIVKETPGVAAEYAELSRTYDVNAETHKKLLSQLESTQVQLNLERASTEKRYEITSPPISYPPPMRSTMAKRAGMGAGVGLVLAILAVIVQQLRAWYRGIPQRRAIAMAGATRLHAGVSRDVVPTLPQKPSSVRGDSRAELPPFPGRE